MKTIGVVHLVRASNGIEPFRRFLTSYLAHPAAIDHELLIVFKGFQRPQLSGYQYLLRDVAHRTLMVDDWGFDITPYLRAARTFEHSAFCFLNSFSEILADNWLGILYHHWSQAGVGMVGASGSWESVYTDLLRTLEAKRTASIATRMRYVLLIARYRRLFAPFPNHHLRTNAFLIDSGLLRRIHIWPMRAKRDVQRFESGRHGLTKQVQAQDLQVLVAGRNGEAYTSDSWWCSNTFRQGDQGNLLVADNRTNDYAHASSDERHILTTFAWGNNDTHRYASRYGEVSE